MPPRPEGSVTVGGPGLTEMHALFARLKVEAGVFARADAPTDEGVAACMALYRQARTEHGADAVRALNALLSGAEHSAARDALSCELFTETVELLCAEDAAVREAAAALLVSLASSCSARELYTMTMDPLSRTAHEHSASVLLRVLASILGRLRPARSWPQFAHAAAESLHHCVAGWPASWFRPAGELCGTTTVGGDHSPLHGAFRALAAPDDGPSEAAQGDRATALLRLIVALYARTLVAIATAPDAPPAGADARAPEPAASSPAEAVAADVHALCGGGLVLFAWASTPHEQLAALALALGGADAAEADGESGDGSDSDSEGNVAGRARAEALRLPPHAAALAYRLARVRALSLPPTAPAAAARFAPRARGPRWELADEGDARELAADAASALRLVAGARALLDLTRGGLPAVAAAVELLHATFRSLARLPAAQREGSWLATAGAAAALRAEQALEAAMEGCADGRVRAAAAEAHSALLDALPPAARLLRVRARLACALDDECALCPGVASLLAMRVADELRAAKAAASAVAAVAGGAAGGLASPFTLDAALGLLPLLLDAEHDALEQYERAMGGLNLARHVLLQLQGHSSDAQVRAVRALLARQLEPVDARLRARMDELWLVANGRAPKPDSDEGSVANAAEVQMCFTRFQLQLSVLERVKELAKVVLERPVPETSAAAPADG
ncbi:hypothetical protein T492DRAFT_1146119 [Pavlovales sp. CCMP2436]|nr:hypothetical protein T492DRAFT_1146119 [Pavlovales sp. CCMP2436]